MALYTGILMSTFNSHTNFPQHVVVGWVSFTHYCRRPHFTTKYTLYTFSHSYCPETHKKSHLRCNSSSDFYPVYCPGFFSPSPQPLQVATSQPSLDLWHHRLGHPNSRVLSSLVSRKSISRLKMPRSAICNACQLGKHNRLHFSRSTSRSSLPFTIVHVDLWTSPFLSFFQL